MIKVTTQDTADELYEKGQEYLTDLYNVLLTGVKLGLLQCHLEGESCSPKDMIEGVMVDVDEVLSNIVDEFNYAAKKKINDVYLSVIDEV